MTQTPKYRDLLIDLQHFKKQYERLNKAKPTTMRVSREIGNRRLRHMFASAARNLGMTIVWFDSSTYQGGRLE